MTEKEKHEQRISFAYGNVNIDNDNVTKRMVQEIAKKQIQND